MTFIGKSILINRSIEPILHH